MVANKPPGVIIQTLIPNIRNRLKSPGNEHYSGRYGYLLEKLCHQQVGIGWCGLRPYEQKCAGSCPPASQPI